MKLRRLAGNKIEVPDFLYKKLNLANQVQDIYLFVGSQLPGIGEKLTSLGYDPNNPTQEAIDATKKAFKKERGIAKVVELGSKYGMGPRKMRQDLGLEGIELTEEEAFELWKGYWNIFAEVRKFGYKLEEEWKRNGGWFLNGIGRPITCAESKKKDLINRHIQSTGHDAHMMYIQILRELVAEVQLPTRGAIWDFHDETIVQVPRNRAEEMIAIYKKAYKILNERLRNLNPEFTIEIKGSPKIVENLADAKLEEGQ